MINYDSINNQTISEIYLALTCIGLLILISFAVVLLIKCFDKKTVLDQQNRLELFN